MNENKIRNTAFDVTGSAINLIFLLVGLALML